MDVWCIYACKIEWMKFLCCLSAVNCDCNTFWMCLYSVHEYVECVRLCVCVSVHKAISKSIVNAHVHCTLFSCTSTAIYLKWLFSRFILLYASIEKRFSTMVVEQEIKPPETPFMLLTILLSERCAISLIIDNIE